MTHGKRLTKKQKIYLKSKGLNYENWLVCKDTTELMVIQHKLSGKYKQLKKVMENA